MSEASRHLYLHTLSLAPKERLRRTKKLPSPEPYLGAEGYGMLEHSVSARWAPDDTIVLLLYSITDVDDPRKDESGQFQVSICVMPCMLHAGTVHCMAANATACVTQLHSRPVDAMLSRPDALSSALM